MPQRATAWQGVRVCACTWLVEGGRGRQQDRQTDGAQQQREKKQILPVGSQTDRQGGQATI